MSMMAAISQQLQKPEYLAHHQQQQQNCFHHHQQQMHHQQPEQRQECKQHLHQQQQLLSPSQQQPPSHQQQQQLLSPSQQQPPSPSHQQQQQLLSPSQQQPPSPSHQQQQQPPSPSTHQQQQEQPSPSLNQQEQEKEKEVLEDGWLEEVKGWYPDRRTRTLYLPPLWFNRVPYDVVDVAGQPVLAIQPSSDLEGRAGKSLRRPTYPAPSSVPNSGGQAPQVPIPALGVWAPPPTQPALLPRLQHNSLVDDETIQGFLERLGHVADRQGEVMMVISGLTFDNYLSSHRGLFPTPRSMKDKQYHRGDFDVLIIHKTLGLITCEIKAVGQHDTQSSADLNNSVLKRVETAVWQLEKETAVLRHLVSDTEEPDVHVTKTLILPNITASQLQDALVTNTTLLANFISCLGARDVGHAISLCLCKDESLSDTCTTTVWWNELKQHAGKDPHMSDHLYDRLLARFCGPDTKVYIPTATALSGKVIRTQAQAVAETGHRVSVLALYQQQLALLRLPCTSQLPDRMYLFGPAGTGKTVVLVLRGLMWLHHGQRQHLEVVSVWRESRAVSILIENQLWSAVTGSAPQSFLKRFSYDFAACPQDVQQAVKDLRERAKDTDGHLHLIVDEMSRVVSERFTQFITELDKAVDHVSVWCAGLHRPDHLPAGMQTQTLTEPLRCTPEVECEVSRSFYMGDAMDCPTPCYSDRTAPPPTKGLPVVQLAHHTGAPGHSLGFPENCDTCGNNITSRLQNFTSPNVSERLEWRDMLILCDNPSDKSAMVQAMRKGNIPVKVVTSTAGEEELRNMALGTNDEVVVTDLSTAAGLERKVVVGMEQTIVTYICHIVGMAFAKPRESWLIRFMLMLVILHTSIRYDTIRRLLLTVEVDMGIICTSIALCVSFDDIKEKYGGYMWCRPMFAYGPIGLGICLSLVLSLMTTFLLDDLSRLLVVSVIFCVASAGFSSMILCSTGYALSGMLVTMILIYGVTNVLIPVSFVRVLEDMFGIKAFRILGMMVEAFLCIMAGTLSGGRAGRLFSKGTLQCIITRGLLIVIISVPSLLALLFFTSNAVVQGSEKDAESMMQTDSLLFNESSGICKLEDDDQSVIQTSNNVYLILSDSVVIHVVAVLLGVHGGMVGKLVVDHYIVRRSSRDVKRINVGMMFLVTCFVLLLTWRTVRTVDAAVSTITAADILCASVTVYTISVAVGMFFGWSEYRQGCYPNYAMSRSSSQLLWIGEPNIANSFLVKFWVLPVFYCMFCALLDFIWSQFKKDVDMYDFLGSNTTTTTSY